MAEVIVTNVVRLLKTDKVKEYNTITCLIEKESVRDITDLGILVGDCESYPEYKQFELATKKAISYQIMTENDPSILSDQEQISKEFYPGVYVSIAINKKLNKNTQEFELIPIGLAKVRDGEKISLITPIYIQNLFLNKFKNNNGNGANVKKLNTISALKK